MSHLFKTASLSPWFDMPSSLYIKFLICIRVCSWIFCSLLCTVLFTSHPVVTMEVLSCMLVIPSLFFPRDFLADFFLFQFLYELKNTFLFFHNHSFSSLLLPWFLFKSFRWNVFIFLLSISPISPSADSVKEKNLKSHYSTCQSEKSNSNEKPLIF